ncbi:hypothetical protein [Seohaeicola zhoushanensis]|uniref:Cyclase n=1 Tax=Seohaeicola zhoushanensis TaxID=1569283 RepID=A0A8J3M593_9RHOB|nr:hypothetical protein [Seohaeicola zhoushanensis]GHF38097.1 hypothetical protein GCM10017056_07560 [Seohaeicola zhoushanensis]
MHLLTETTAPDFATWKSAFDADTEDRGTAGLTLLQMWRGADDPNAVTCLFEVNDRDRAQAWLDKEAALGHGVSARFLRTA